MEIPTYEELFTRLIKACKTGDLEQVKHLHSRGININADNNYALRWASNNGQLKIVKYIIENSASTNIDSNLSLILALNNKHLEIVDYLFSLYENKEDAFRFILENVNQKVELPILKYIVDNYDLDGKALQEI